MSIKARELRIDNLVEHEGECYKIHTIAKVFPTLDTIRFGIGVIDWNNINPIPLTEEWLVRFGFEVVKKDWTFATHKTNIEFTINNAINGDWRFTPIWCTDYSPILSVHQLQNLYFSLTGEELTIKE